MTNKTQNHMINFQKVDFLLPITIGLMVLYYNTKNQKQLSNINRYIGDNFYYFLSTMEICLWNRRI